ncbi:unnamed protein product [Trichobilharzia regenti]|nr:unnamed protein product [Trichobilharzia regenti]
MKMNLHVILAHKILIKMILMIQILRKILMIQNHRTK